MAIQSNARKKFPKRRRLLRHSDFEQVYKKGRRFFGKYMTVFYLATEDESAGSRVGFTVGKALGDAVQRNRMKRRLREAVRLSGLEHGLTADVVINPKRSLLTADFADLTREVGKAFEAMGKALSRNAAQN